MKSHIISALAVCALAAPLANAQVTVIGGGMARECFESAKHSWVSPSEGEKMCTRALNFETLNVSNRAATYTNRGVFRMRGGDYDRALDDYDKAKRLRPELGEIYLNEGAALIYKKDFDAALDTLNRAIELESDDLFAAHYNRAIAREKLQDYQGAYEDFKMALELKPDWEMAKWQVSRFVVETN